MNFTNRRSGKISKNNEYCEHKLKVKNKENIENNEYNLSCNARVSKMTGPKTFNETFKKNENLDQLDRTFTELIESLTNN